MQTGQGYQTVARRQCVRHADREPPPALASTLLQWVQCSIARQKREHMPAPSPPLTLPTNSYRLLMVRLHRQQRQIPQALHRSGLTPLPRPAHSAPNQATHDAAAQTLAAILLTKTVHTLESVWTRVSLF